MRRKLFYLLVAILTLAGFVPAGMASISPPSVLAAPTLPPDLQWSQTYGGVNADYGYSVKPTADGGYIIAGYTDSFGLGGNEVYLVKTDSAGNKTWSQTFGGAGNDWANSVQQTSDGGYIITGLTNSFADPVADVYLIKTNTAGNMTWQRTFGGAGYDEGHSVQQTSDGGYIIGGASTSYNAGDWDVYLIKTDASGNMIWQKTFGGTGQDVGNSMQVTADGGYIITGSTTSSGVNNIDVYLVKTDSTGNKTWEKTFGGPNYQGWPAYSQGDSVDQTTDGGYIIAGQINSGGSTPYHIYLLRTDTSGNKTWSQTFGESLYSSYPNNSVQQTTDGGYIIGSANLSSVNGSPDVYLIKTDASGTMTWEKTIGGVSGDFGRSIQQTADGGYVLTGGNNGDVYLVKLGAEVIPCWSEEPDMPSDDPGVNQLVPGSDVTDLAVASDGTTIYAIAANATSGLLVKSTDKGTRWSRLTYTTNATEIPKLVAVAPGAANTLLVATAANSVFLSTDGGLTFSELTGANFTTINDIAISPLVSGVRYISVAGINSITGLGDVQYFNLGGPAPAWASMTGADWGGSSFSGNVTITAIAFSPNFAADRIMVAVTNSATPATLLEVASFSTRKLNAAAGFTGYPVTVLGEASTAADISLAPTYLGADETLRAAFLALSTGAGSGKLSRLDNVIMRDLVVADDFKSVAFNGTNLVAGADTSNRVYYSANPMATPASVVVSNVTLYQRPGGVNRVKVAWAGANVVAGTSGISSAFALSKDKGATFNDISLIDTKIINMRDVAITPDGNTVYLASDDNVTSHPLSLWRRMPSWERVLTVIGSDVGNILRLTSDNTSNVYVANSTSTFMLYTDDSGEERWMARSLIDAPADLAVESAQTIYALSHGTVYKSTNAGFIWDSGTPTGLSEDGATITSIKANQLVVGGSTNGSVAWSSDGGATWTPMIGSNAPFASGLVHVTADDTSNGFVYAATSTPNASVKRWHVGVSTYWDDIISGSLTGGATGQVLWNGVLNALTDASADGLSRCNHTFTPIIADATTNWTSCNTTAIFDNMPQALKASTGKLWAIDNNTIDALYVCNMLAVGTSSMPVTTDDAADITSVSGQLHGSLVSLGTAASANVSFQWGLISGNYTNETPVQSMNSTGPFSYILTGLSANTTYYYRTKVVGDGTSYGSEKSFTTTAAIEGVHVLINTPGKVAPDRNFTAIVNISPVHNFDAANFDVSFDPAVIRLDNVTSGNIGGIAVPIVAWNQREPWRFSVTVNVPGLTGVNGTGYLAALHFHVVGSLGQTSDINLTGGALSSTAAVAIPAAWQGKSVQVAMVPGDASGDGIVNAIDITKVERIIAHLDSSTPGADANRDGNIDALDITKVERIIVGLD